MKGLFSIRQIFEPTLARLPFVDFLIFANILNLLWQIIMFCYWLNLKSLQNLKQMFLLFFRCLKSSSLTQLSIFGRKIFNYEKNNFERGNCNFAVCQFYATYFNQCKFSVQNQNPSIWILLLNFCGCFKFVHQQLWQLLNANATTTVEAVLLN